MTGFDLYGSVGKLTGLASDQSSHEGKMSAILEQVRQAATDAKGNWDGAGNPEFTSSSDKFDTHANDVMAAFRRMINATDEAANLWSTATRTIRARW